MRYLFVIVFFFVFSASSLAEENAPQPDGEIKIVQASAVAYFEGDRGEPQTRAMALNRARQNALEKAVGIRIGSDTVLYNGELISDLVRMATKGLILDEKVKSDIGVEGEGSGKRVFVKVNIEAHIKPVKEIQSSLKILKASVQMPGKEAITSPVFQNNDEVQIRITLNEDAYVSIFSVDQYGNLSKLLPNEYVKTEPVRARKEFVFPDDSLRVRGLKFRVVTPQKLNSALESALIIVTKAEPHFLEDPKLENPTVTDLMRELSELEDSPWTQKAVGYEVRK